MSNQSLHAEQKLNRADRLLKYSVVFFIIYLIAANAFVVYQVFDVQTKIAYQTKQQLDNNAQASKEARERLQTALSENAKQHVITQQYVRCIGIVLLKPLSERNTSDFDACGLNGTVESNATNSSNGSTASSNQLPTLSSNQPQQVTQSPTTPQPNEAVPQTPSNTTPTTPPATTSVPPEPKKQGLRQIPLVDTVFNLLGV